MQSEMISRMNIREPVSVGLALVAMPQVSFEKRHAGKRRPYIQLHRYGQAVLMQSSVESPEQNQKVNADIRCKSSNATSEDFGLSALN